MVGLVMTYCVGLLLDEGCVLLSDSRTNAGLDNVATYRKMFTFERPGEVAIAVLTAGSLSITQTVIARLNESIAKPSEDVTSILDTGSMLQVAELVGATLLAVTEDISGKLARMSQSATASMLVAGQFKGRPMRLFLIYPEGNFIEATPDTPFLQIGEHKYGKPILDRVVKRNLSLEDARKAVFLSMDSTLRSNLSVGLPLDYCVIREGECRISERERIDAGNEKFQAMSQIWSDALREAFRRVSI
jgi:putative proteasome-type protease